MLEWPPGPSKAAVPRAYLRGSVAPPPNPQALPTCLGLVVLMGGLLLSQWAFSPSQGMPRRGRSLLL